MNSSFLSVQHKRLRCEKYPWFVIYKVVRVVLQAFRKLLEHLNISLDLLFNFNLTWMSCYSNVITPPKLFYLYGNIQVLHPFERQINEAKNRTNRVFMEKVTLCCYIQYFIYHSYAHTKTNYYTSHYIQFENWSYTYEGYSNNWSYLVLSDLICIGTARKDLIGSGW